MSVTYYNIPPKDLCLTNQCCVCFETIVANEGKAHGEPRYWLQKLVNKTSTLHHPIHTVCLEKWTKQREKDRQQPNCPLCRANIEVPLKDRAIHLLSKASKYTPGLLTLGLSFPYNLGALSVAAIINPAIMRNVELAPGAFGVELGVTQAIICGAAIGTVCGIEKAIRHIRRDGVNLPTRSKIQILAFSIELVVVRTLSSSITGSLIGSLIGETIPPFILKGVGLVSGTFVGAITSNFFLNHMVR
jgi:hypothetical protein